MVGNLIRYLIPNCAALVAALLVCDGAAAQSGSSSGHRALDEELQFDGAARESDTLRRQRLLAGLLAAEPLLVRRPRRKTLDLTPLAERAISLLRESGIPLVEHRDEKRRPIAVSASFHVGDDLPDVRLHVGDLPPEPMGAFYPPEKGFRWSIVYPLRELSLRVEGGDDSEFGSVAFAGLQWVHPNQRLAAGFGVPVKLDNSDSDFGAVFQFRMKLP